MALTRAISYMVEAAVALMRVSSAAALSARPPQPQIPMSSEQGWNHDLPRWCGNQRDELHLEGSFRLSYNGSVFVKEGLGYLLTFRHLIDTSPGSGLTFRPLTPRLETGIYLIWKKYQVFTPIAERLLAYLKECFSMQI